MKSHRILLALLLASTLVLLTPNVGAQAGTTLEDFESYTPPETPDGSGVNGAYTHSINGGGSSITTTAQAHDGNQSMRLEGSTFNYGLNNLGESFCGVSWWVFFTAFPTTAPYWMGITDAAQATPFNPASNPDEWAAFSITTTGVVQRQYDSNDAGAAVAAANFGLTLSLSTWYNFVIDCSPAGQSGTLLFYETTTDTVVQIGAQTFDDHLDLMSFAGDPAGTSAGAYTVYVDDIALPFTPLSPGVIFCADPSLGTSANWGYDYKENASFEEDLTDTSTFIGLEDGFLLTGDSTDSAYLGKAFTPGTQAIRQVARIEADTELRTSVVRMAFTTGTATLSSGSTGDGAGDQTAAGNGQDSGNFVENLQAVLIEDDDQWVVSIRYTDGGSLTQILGSANYGANPGTAHTFSFIVNTGTTTITGPLVDSQNHTIFTGSIGPGKAQLRGEAGTIIERDVPAGLVSAEWKDSWVIAKGDTAIETRTVLDDNTDAGQTDDSTCVFDLLGTAVVVGESGSSPGSFIVVPDEEPGAGSGGLFDPANIDSGLFIGFLLVAGMIFTGARQGIVGMGLVGVFLLGLGLGFALGWIPLWLVLVMFVVSLAAVWFLPKPSGDGVS